MVEAQDANDNHCTGSILGVESGVQVLEDEVEVMNPPPKKKGRAPSPIWFELSDANSAPARDNTKCKHCKNSVAHYKKSEKAKSHLNNCPEFQKKMKQTLPHERPVWYTGRKAIVRTKSLFLTPSPPLHKQSVNALVVQRRSDSSMEDYTIRNLTKAEIKKFQERLAMFFYTTGTAFARIENKYLHEAMMVLNPSVKIPTRKDLAGVLLEFSFNNISKDVDSRLRATQTWCLVSDAWTNVKGESIINYIAVEPKHAIFLESKTTGTTGHSAVFIAEDIQRVIEKIPCVVAGVVTDNTSANKKAWSILQQKYRNKYFYGCASHALHLMVKDIFQPGKKIMRDTSYPFEYLRTFTTSCKNVVNFFTNSCIMRAKLAEAQRKHGLKEINLAIPAPTRWGSLQQCFSTLLHSEAPLHTIVNDRDFISGGKIEEKTQLKFFISHENFPYYLRKCLAILKPVDSLIVKYQSNTTPLSDVYHDFWELENEKFQNEDLLKEDEKTFLSNVARRRFDFICTPAHGMAYVLDPRYLGKHMTFRALMDFKKRICTDEDPYKPIHMMQQLNDCMEVLRDARDNQMLEFEAMKKRSNILQFWKINCDEFKLIQPVALNLFTLAASSAESERNFSTMGFVHSKLRNSLKVDTVQKLVYIKSNASHMTDNFTESCEWTFEYKKIEDIDEERKQED